jgi:hypothetical protein
MAGIALFALATLSAGIAPQPAQSPVQGAWPMLQAYRTCGARTAAQLDRDRPSDAPEVLARNATLRCDALLPSAVAEAASRAGLAGSRNQLMAEFRQRSIAELADRINAQRANKK